MRSHRRNFLMSGGLATLGVSLLRANGSASLSGTGKRPKNIVYMVSDGMSAGAIALAEIASQADRRRPTNWATLLRDPSVARGMFDQASLSSSVTDSAAASSSWGSGSRVRNGAINTLPDGTALVPLAKLAKEKGLGVGLVTTTSIWDATPAGFASSVPKRSQYEDIVKQYLNRVDVLMGGGRDAFLAEKRADKQDLVAAYRDSGYRIANTKQETGVVKPGDRLLALYGSGSLPYTIDHVRNQADAIQIPTLAEMASAALTALSTQPKGFLLQIEGARIDHTAHANDAAALIQEQLAFDEALGVALRFAQQRGDTLVVICTDHGNANPGLNSMGGASGSSDQCLARAMKATASFTEIAKRLGNRADYTMDAAKASDARAVAERLVTNTFKETHGIDLSPAHARAIASAAAGEKGISLNAQQDTLVGVTGQVLANYLGIGFVGTSHTADYATSTAFGPGSEHFEGLLRNTDVFQKLTMLMDTPYHNASADERMSARSMRVADTEPRQWAV